MTTRLANEIQQSSLAMSHPGCVCSSRVRRGCVRSTGVTSAVATQRERIEKGTGIWRAKKDHALEHKLCSV